MKRETLDKISIVASLSGLSVALLSVILELTLANNQASAPVFKYMIGATAAAAFGASLKLAASRRRPKKERGRIFLIYAKEDREKVEALYNHLDQSGFKPWIDSKDILPGQDWRSSIKKAIEESDIALACLSKNVVNKKGFVQAELKLALDLLDERAEGFSPVIPVRLEDTEVPERLRGLQWVDLYKDGSMQKLQQAIKKATALS